MLLPAFCQNIVNYCKYGELVSNNLNAYIVAIDAYIVALCDVWGPKDESPPMEYTANSKKVVLCKP